jgi:hypothetical protein
LCRFRDVTRGGATAYLAMAAAPPIYVQYLVAHSGICETFICLYVKIHEHLGKFVKYRVRKMVNENKQLFVSTADFANMYHTITLLKPRRGMR